MIGTNDADKAVTARTHPLPPRQPRVAGRKRYCLGDALGIDPARSDATDALVNRMVAQDSSLWDIVVALSEREMTDAEFAVAMYALGLFDCQTRGVGDDE